MADQRTQAKAKVSAQRVYNDKIQEAKRQAAALTMFLEALSHVDTDGDWGWAGDASDILARVNDAAGAAWTLAQNR